MRLRPHDYAVTTAVMVIIIISYNNHILPDAGLRHSTRSTDTKERAANFTGGFHVALSFVPPVISSH